jgi:hypothetical protein
MIDKQNEKIVLIKIIALSGLIKYEEQKIPN